MKYFPRALLAITLALTMTVARAADNPAPHWQSGRALFARCVSCHQPQGWGSQDGNIPNIAGQHAKYLEKQIKLFRGGVRRDEAMRVVAEHPELANPRDVAALTRYIAALAPNPRPKQGPGDHLSSGQETYDHICAACHGPDGAGQRSAGVPRIGGQHFPYLLRQIGSAAALHRDLAPPEMTSGLRGLGESERAALADYISRLGGPVQPPGNTPIVITR
jgi:cytochrome c553